MTVTADDIVSAADSHRRELLAYCYRMTGSLHDAEDLVQETMLRAWRAASSYDPQRASVRTWLYRIATNACLTTLKTAARRALPMDLSQPSPVTDVGLLTRQPELPWLEPFPDALLDDGDPAAVVASRASIRLAFIAALQHLPPLQRAVLILRDVLALRANEVAELLGTTSASANSALQRARAQLPAVPVDDDALTEPSDAEQRELLNRYVSAFEALDVDALKKVLREDALLQMLMPVIAYDLLEAISLLAAASKNFADRCIRGLEANRERATGFIEQSLAMCTVLAPEIGYDKAAAIAKEAYATGRTVREVARERSGISEDRLNQLLDPATQAGH